MFGTGVRSQQLVDDLFDQPGFAGRVFHPICQLGRAAFDLFDNTATERMKRGHLAFEIFGVDRKLLGYPFHQLIGRALVEGEHQNLFRAVELFVEDIGDLADHGGGLARAGRCNEKIVVLQSNASLALLVGQRPAVQVVEERSVSRKFAGNERIVIFVADIGIGDEGE
ncbi:hypothetical protein ASD31_22450 [Rhizobium sp. Root482]|nr:hypothetical protein ASD31_22450 [Rhizobium sp. Root482]